MSFRSTTKDGTRSVPTTAMQLGFVTAILPDLRFRRRAALRRRGAVRLRRGDVLACRQGHPPLCGRDAHRRRRTSVRPRPTTSTRCAKSTGSASPALGYYPNILSGDADEARIADRAPEAGDRRRPAAGAEERQHVHRRRPSRSAGAELRPLQRSLARHRPRRRGLRRVPGHRELPDAVLEGRMALGQEPGLLAAHLAADVRGHPVGAPGAELRSVAPGLADDGLRAADLRVPPQAVPCPRQGHEDRAGQARRRRAFSPAAGARPRCRGWAR